MFDGIIDALRGVARDLGLNRSQEAQPTPKQISLSPEQVKHIADNIDLYESIDPEIGKKMREYLKTSLPKQGADNFIGPQPQADPIKSLNPTEVEHGIVTTLDGTPAINPDQINLTASQALINDYYRRGGGTYAGAARLAAQDGNDFNKIVAERNRLQGILGYNKPVYVAKAVANDNRQPSQPVKTVQGLDPVASIPLAPSQSVSAVKIPAVDLASRVATPDNIMALARELGYSDKDVLGHLSRYSPTSFYQSLLKEKELKASGMLSGLPNYNTGSQKSDIGKAVVDMAKQGSHAIHRNQANPYVHY